MDQKVYLEKVIKEIPRLLSMQNRNPSSKTFGSFDRIYWMDKATDFPSGLAQFGVLPLTYIYCHKLPGLESYFKNKKLLIWIKAGMKYWCSIQKSDGSFDEFYVNEFGWGPTEFTLYSMAESFKLLKNELNSSLVEKMEETFSLAAKYLIDWDEPGILANHHAIACLAVYSAYDILKEQWILEGYKEKWQGFIRYHNYDEGWSMERDGADPGYLSGTISFLGKLYKLNPSKEIKEIIEQSIVYSSYFLYPDGNFAGTVGSRHTVHFYTHGYELFANKNEMAKSMIKFSRAALNKDKQVHPAIVPDRYFVYRMPEFIISYLDAYSGKLDSCINLPFQKKPFREDFVGSGHSIINTETYYAVIASKKGGVYKIFDKKKKSLLDSDCGYYGILNNKKVSTHWQTDDWTISEASDFEINGKFYFIPDKFPNPFTFILLRLALLTIGSITYGSFILKDKIIKILMTGKKEAPVNFNRKFIFQKKSLIIEDKIEILNNSIFLELMNIDEFSTIMVPQSQYFQDYELNSNIRNIGDSKISELNDSKKINIRRKISFD